MPRPVTMPIANDKRRRPERTEAIRILKPAISNIPRSVSATVAAHANGTVNELGKRDVTAPVYSTKWAKSPQDTFFAPGGPHKPKRSATADRKEAPSANRANRRTISVPFSLSCSVFEFIRASTSRLGLHYSLKTRAARSKALLRSPLFSVSYACFQFIEIEWACIAV